MRFSPLGAFFPSGSLLSRLRLSHSRLSSPLYTYPESYNDGNGWPGDWPGRAILAQVLLSQALHAEPSPLPANLAHLPELLNAAGYVGPIPPEVNEQQLSGNSWFLRALCEEYERSHDPQVLNNIQTLSRSLYAPLKGMYPVYPKTRAAGRRGWAQNPAQ